MTIQTIGVIGAGAMGAGIANLAALQGFQVILQDIEERFLEGALQRIETFMSKSVQRGKLTEEQKQQTLGRIKTTTALEQFNVVDVAIEAVIEDIEIKKDVFANLDRITSPNTILVSNTSSFSITEIAAETNRPNQVAGLHFFNPAQIMKLVEIVRGYETSDVTVAHLRELVTALGKESIEVKIDAPGFVVNRIMIPQFIEAIRVLEEGIATAEDIDKAIKLGLNHPMGPFELQDFAGIDIGYHVMEYFSKEFNDAQYAPPLLLKQMMRAGRFGKKVGAGFYDYSQKQTKEGVLK
ncbi:3-hydroxyacyl-CoA dehydrogenase NAD-binding domain-containing protein [Lysinibacillus sp. Bpr_S20]|uniref:3-hydroxyacyl-CoA dehydrogenase family protein n=1 Tax=Lysinibacillus sp. Bpr_S20 TaxID=2933964 RepID=UPI0020124F4F|nr:3-hydroxyacyl-CoA dehydrogenase NAD-binding domain-containing protein [Lysinibacillus sp. Bpr_S20]MCL1699469.1 3-hydroxyacyl-CoA dehydrogenase NAD-binding domain-containing protein [Lysinibacillus sp. Bpr_S20]